MKASKTSGAKKDKNIETAIGGFIAHRKTHWEKSDADIRKWRVDHPGESCYVIDFWEGDGVPAELNAKLKTEMTMKELEDLGPVSSRDFRTGRRDPSTSPPA